MLVSVALCLLYGFSSRSSSYICLIIVPADLRSYPPHAIIKCMYGEDLEPSFTESVYLINCFLKVHLAGMMTDLPHHPASGPEVEGLMQATSLLLKAAAVSRVGLTRLPSLVTVAR